MPTRVLSHTTLERKVRLIFGLMILLIIVAVLFFPWRQMESLVRDLDRESAQHMAITAWLAMPSHAHSKEAADTFQKFAAMGPAPVKPKADPPRIIVPDAPPGRPDLQPRDEKEQRWLQKFAASPVKAYEEDRGYRDNGFYYRYAEPLRARASCIDCHRSLGRENLQPGDLMGAIVIAFPVEETREKIIINRSILIAAAIATAILSMIVFYALFRWVIVQPVQHLRTVAERVTAGDLHVRADISTGDEFENLARTFNRMLQALESSREQLRQANASLDRKLEELARANVSLFEMNQVKSKFLATMSHELRTPLNAIIGFADILRENRAIADDPKLARYVGNIQSSGQLLLDIINDLLDLAKIEAGKIEIKLGRVSPLDICETAMNMVRPMVGSKALALELDVDPQCPIMTTDANKLQQILYNLLSNAVKFTPQGTVRLTVRPIDAETILFQVSDTGPGLTAEQQKIIFDRFSQVDQGHTRQYGGTGLGLSIVKELVDVLGGDVAVQSTPGAGATFNVTLPLVTVAEPESPLDRAPVTHVESRPEQRLPSPTKAPEPITAEDTVIAADVESDLLAPHPTSLPDEESVHQPPSPEAAPDNHELSG